MRTTRDHATRLAAQSSRAKRMFLDRAAMPEARVRRARLAAAGVLPDFVEVDITHAGVPGNPFLLETGSPVDQVARQVWLDGAGSYESPWPVLVAALGSEIERAIVVGANSGFYAMLLAGREGVKRVDALEPFRPAFLRMTENIRASGLEGQVVSHSVAAGAAPGQMTLYIPEPLSKRWPLETSASLDPSFKSDHSAEHIVTVTTVDLIAEESSIPVGMLFIDAEGCDLDVVAGGESTIARDSPFVVVEVTEADLVRLNEFLVINDYLAFEVSQTGVWARRPVVPAVASTPTIGSATRGCYWSNLLAPAALLNRVESAASLAGLAFFK